MVAKNRNNDKPHKHQARSISTHPLLERKVQHQPKTNRVNQINNHQAKTINSANEQGSQINGITGSTNKTDIS
jgi:hypothetical protein